MNPADILRKLRLNTPKKALIINTPDELTPLFADLPYDKTFNPDMEGLYDYIQVFATSYAELENILRPLVHAGQYDCLFWICYPKGGGRIKSDLKRERIWNAFTLINLRAVSQIAIDDTWSALRGRPEEAVKH
jgi:hypothetical protein